MRKLKIFLSTLICILILSICSCQKTGVIDSKKIYIEKIKSEKYPIVTDDIKYEYLEEAILRSISYLKKLSSERMFHFGPDKYDTGYLIGSLEYFLSFIKNRPSNEELNSFIKKNFYIYQSTGNDNSKEMLFTGYYEPILEGNFERNDEYKFPVYACPNDLVTIDLSRFIPEYKGRALIGRCANKKVEPYHDRFQIEYGGALENKAEVIAWVKDQIGLFFLQIQGSGKIRLQNGDVFNINYQISNGQPYKSIGKLLIDNGSIPVSEMSMQKIREYLQYNPDKIKAVLSYNPSYIFFSKNTDGPFGCLGEKITSGRSIALDRKIFPDAALAYVETKKPIVNDTKEITEWTDFGRIVLNQDTGGAIKGPGRVDFFWGNGEYSEIAAGHMKHIGKLYFLVSKEKR
ncbi:MAG: MltA domain-containing protein [Desulfobacterales bacterium]|nr:MltA domain-containing protein [Desulfobacterales bacterium]